MKRILFMLLLLTVLSGCGHPPPNKLIEMCLQVNGIPIYEDNGSVVTYKCVPRNNVLSYPEIIEYPIGK